MKPRTAAAFICLAISACAVPAAAQAPSCDLTAATPWIQRWFSAWELTSREILRIPDAEAPEVLFYDSLCVYTTSEGSLPGPAAVVDPDYRFAGATMFGKELPWRVAAHGDSLILPNGDRSPVQLMSFANSDRRNGPFFVMAAPSYWRQKIGADEVTGVFLHEFAHTRQVGGMLAVIGPIDATWKSKYGYELDDDAVQNQFEKDSVYVAGWRVERDLLRRAAEAGSDQETRKLAAQALAMMRARHRRWFTGESAVFATLDNLWLSLEGAGQWTGYAWLAHPQGGGMGKPAAYEKMAGRRRRWSQDEGLELFLVVDRLLPGWPNLVFGAKSIGALDLLDRAVKAKPAAARRVPAAR